MPLCGQPTASGAPCARRLGAGALRCRNHMPKTDGERASFRAESLSRFRAGEAAADRINEQGQHCRRRAIVQIDCRHENSPSGAPMTPAWEIDVRAVDGVVDLLEVVAEGYSRWKLRRRDTGELWGTFDHLGDAFMQALDPQVPE